MPKRVLHVIAGMGSGGAEAMIMNWYRHIDRNAVQFDFLLRSTENIYADEIQRMGGRVYYTAEFPKKYCKNKRETEQFFKEHASEYDAIHIHCNALLYVNVFDIAKKYGIKTRIIHSHSTKTKNKVFEFVHKWNKKRIHKKANVFLACSKDAANWAFHDKIQYRVITNAIDAERFKYNVESRQAIRRELGVENSFIVGHVGRFLDVKNHMFLLDVFERINKRRDDAVLILVGTGPLEEKIRAEAEKRGIVEKVLFLGVRKDVNCIYSAMDVFAFPSKYEGIAVALIEAQANGLPCFVSDRISLKCKISKLLKFLSIDTVTEWVNQIEKIDCIDNRDEHWLDVVASGFDIRSNVKELQDCYIGDKSDG